MQKHLYQLNVKSKIERKNTQRLIDDCHKIVDGVPTPKTKTVTIVEQVKDPNYQREMKSELKHLSKYEFKSLMIARYRMLECGQNFKGTLHEMCVECKVIDDENHRLNYCSKYKTRSNTNEYINFDDIYCNNIAMVRPVLVGMERIWNTVNAHGTMRNCDPISDSAENE